MVEKIYVSSTPVSMLDTAVGGINGEHLRRSTSIASVARQREKWMVVHARELAAENLDKSEHTIFEPQIQ